MLPVAGITLVHDAAGPAKKLSNPVAALISVPFQLNYDQDNGPEGFGARLIFTLLYPK
jgi:hypothetical protein